MARYDYDCAACARRFEAVHGVFEDAPTACPLCGSGPVKKAFSPPTIHFKGSGWAKKERQASTASRASRTAAATGADNGSSDGSSSSDTAAATGSPATGAPASSDRPAPSETSGSSKSSDRSDTSAKPAVATTSGGPGGD